MFIVRYRTFFYTLSAILVVGSIVAIAAWGLNLSIDFKGGSLLQVLYPDGRPAQTAVQSAVAPLGLSVTSIVPSGTNEYDIRTETLTDAQENALTGALSALSLAPAPVASSTATTSTMQIVGFNTIGPVLGKEAAEKSLAAIILVIAAIILFIAWAFRKVSEPVSSWKYGIVAVVDLIHNIIIPTGVFAALGHFYGYEVDTLFVTALLVVLGFSVHDTIVVFDRIRENLRLGTNGRPFAETVGASIKQTFVRSVNTSLVVLFALVVLYFVGGISTEHFSLALIIGIAAGTYSSICLGSPLLVTIEKWQRGK
ncbi:MAG: protein translocase subunit SecF [Patescibacteria group bacterium]|nr:protein translocase subunit SecF [Patescibacteria group bacterium]